MNQVGIIVGKGTGRELSIIFKQALIEIASILGKQVQLIECKHEFKSYNQLRNLPLDQIKTCVQEDLTALNAFYNQFYRSGGRAIFKTAINAEALYRFRLIGKAVKLIQIPVNSKKTLLIVRDEMQGFYTNDEYEILNDQVRFTGSFSRENFQLIAHFARKEAKRLLRKHFKVWVVYKHHLFANALEYWARCVIPDSKVYQPNHATELLFKYFQSPEDLDLLMITGNEIGDILHEVLIFHLGIGTRNTLYSKNIYLNADLQGLVEYQTVHGSADNIAGQGIVNPFATLRAVGAVLEEYLNKAGLKKIMEEALQQAEEKRIVTPDMGGWSTTYEVVEYILSKVRAAIHSND